MRGNPTSQSCRRHRLRPRRIPSKGKVIADLPEEDLRQMLHVNKSCPLPCAQEAAIELQAELGRRAAVRHEAKPGWAWLQVAECLAARRKAALDKRVEAHGAATKVYEEAKAALHEAEQKVTAARTQHDEAVAAEKAHRQELASTFPLAASVVSLTKCMQSLKDGSLLQLRLPSSSLSRPARSHSRRRRDGRCRASPGRRPCRPPRRTFLPRRRPCRTRPPQCRWPLLAGRWISLGCRCRRMRRRPRTRLKRCRRISGSSRPVRPSVGPNAPAPRAHAARLTTPRARCPTPAAPSAGSRRAATAGRELDAPE